MTVVMLVIDGIGHRSVTPELVPTLTAWARRGMARPEGATSVMCSSTYPNFASMVTGVSPAAHGLLANEVAVDGSIIPAAEVGPAVPTFFDGSSEVIVGDHHLIGVTAAHGAGRHWPPSGVIPPGCSVDMFGYLTDQEVATRVVEALERSPELLFVQLNSPDTFAHWFGPDSDEAKEAYRDLDHSLAVIEGAIDLERDLLLVTSDHDQETVDPSSRIDLAALAGERNPDLVVIHEGSAAVITGPGDVGWLDEVSGVESWKRVGGEVVMAFSQAGWWFAHPDFPDFRGAHGGPRTRSTIAVAAGPPDMLEAIRPDFLSARFGAEDWSGLVQVARSNSGLGGADNG
jgi:hypothetical protein